MSSHGGGLGDHLLGTVLGVRDDVVAGDCDHRDTLVGEIPAKCGEPGGDVLNVRAVVADEGDDEGGTRKLVEADRRAGGGLGQCEERRGRAEREHRGLDGHAHQSRPTAPAPGMIASAGVLWALAEI